MHTDGHRKQGVGQVMAEKESPGSKKKSKEAAGQEGREEVPQWRVPPFLGGEELVARVTPTFNILASLRGL